MTHDELLAKIINYPDTIVFAQHYRALRAVVELHKPNPDDCACCGPVLCYSGDGEVYPCPTIQAVEKELQ